jgi:hypothetical protein
MTRKDDCRIYDELFQLYAGRKKEASSNVIPRLQPCERRTAKEKSRTSSQEILWEDVLLQIHLTKAVLHSCTVSRHATSATKGTVDVCEKLAAPRAAASATIGNSENRSVSKSSQFV